MDDPDGSHKHACPVKEEIVVEDEECVICMAAKATMKTFPCEHKVVCRKCFIKTIQTAVATRCLPLRCVICRSQILKLRQISPMSSLTPGHRKKSKSSQRTSLGHKLFSRGQIQQPMCTK